MYENLEEQNPSKKRKLLIVFDEMIPDMKANKMLNPTVAELFLRERKLQISLAFISQSYIKVAGFIRLSTIHYFIIKKSNKRELQQNCIRSFSQY